MTDSADPTTFTVIAVPVDVEPDLPELERRLGVRFKDRGLLRQALVHKSLTNELGLSGLHSNERLEFLGDSVLGMLVSEQLFRQYQNRDEGQLTLLRSALVRASSLATWARTLDLASFVLMGRGEIRAGARDRDTLLSSVFEAILGAVFLDRGFATARRLVLRFAGKELAGIGERQVIDAKSRLQQVSQARFAVTPTYDVLDISGSGHSPVFTVRVQAGGGVEAVAVGRSKQTAQQTAAAEALATIEAMPPDDAAADADAAAGGGDAESTPATPTAVTQDAEPDDVQAEPEAAQAPAGAPVEAPAT